MSKVDELRDLRLRKLRESGADREPPRTPRPPQPPGPKVETAAPVNKSTKKKNGGNTLSAKNTSIRHHPKIKVGRRSVGNRVGKIEGREFSAALGLKIKVGRPRLEDKDKTLTALKPWEAYDPPMSKRTWYRRQKDKKR